MISSHSSRLLTFTSFVNIQSRLEKYENKTISYLNELLHKHEDTTFGCPARSVDWRGSCGCCQSPVALASLLLQSLLRAVQRKKWKNHCMFVFGFFHFSRCFSCTLLAILTCAGASCVFVSDAVKSFFLHFRIFKTAVNLICYRFSLMSPLIGVLRTIVK